ncbi:MAG: cyclopropane fatty acyl phospholipid synthase [Patescibacteria group bacterium]
MNPKQTLHTLLSYAGLTINGPHPYDPQIHNEQLYQRILTGGSLALGESYMDGWWDCEALDEMVCRLIRARVNEKVGMSFETLFYILKSKILNLQSKRGARKVIDEHYDLGNDLYMSFLDPYNQYTCGYFAQTKDDLNKAQEDKLDLICRKLQLKKEDHLLDIGCGWGGLAKFAAEKYGCTVTGVSISDEQIAYAQSYTKGLPVEILKCDYRDLTGSYDKVVSVGMIEHVGYKNHRTMMKTVRNILKDDGLFLLHHIGSNKTTTLADPWFHKYIFPNGLLPSIKQIAEAIEGIFVMEDWHNFGPYYDPTLMAWMKNFDAAWPQLKEKYNERFYRMWRYYLLSMAGAFRSRQNNQLWQIVLSKNGVLGGYTSVR